MPRLTMTTASRLTTLWVTLALAAMTVGLAATAQADQSGPHPGPHTGQPPAGMFPQAGPVQASTQIHIDTASLVSAAGAFGTAIGAGLWAAVRVATSYLENRDKTAERLVTDYQALFQQQVTRDSNTALFQRDLIGGLNTFKTETVIALGEHGKFLVVLGERVGGLEQDQSRLHSLLTGESKDK